MTCMHTDLIYENLPERLLEKMWGEIKGHTLKSLSSLMKSISANEQCADDPSFPPPYSVQMYDPWNGKWIAFCLSSAWSIVKSYPDQFCIRMRLPLPHSDPGAPKLWGWQSVPSLALSEYLSHCSLPPCFPVEEEKDTLMSWQQMIEQDKQEYTYQGRYWPWGDTSTAYLERERV